MSIRRRHRDRRRSRGQSLIEFALVTPLLLLIFSAAVDFGRAFYGFVALENAVKEGALYGARNPLCTDVGPECPEKKTVIWRIENEAPDDTTAWVVAECRPAGSATPYADPRDCKAGDTYIVSAEYAFSMITPLLDNVIGGEMTLYSEASATVLNKAFDPTPGLGPLKLVNVGGAGAPRNAAEIIAKCEEPFPGVYDGYYPSPCADTVGLGDDIYATYREGDTIGYKITVRNNGGSTVTGITATDSLGWPGACSAVPTSMAVTASVYECNYTRTAPTVSSGATMNYSNVLTVDGVEIEPAIAEVTVRVEKPPADLRVLKYVSVYKEGSDGDGSIGGTASFGTTQSVGVRYSALQPSPQVWFKIIVTNIGGQTATGVSITDTRGTLPFGQNNANAVCNSAPSSLAVGARFECRYRVTFSSASAATNNNTAAATATGVTPDGNDNSTATVTVASCTGGTNRVVPNLIGLTKTAAQTAWTSAGFTSALGVWGGNNSAIVVAQNQQAYSCLGASSAMTVSRTNT